MEYIWNTLYPELMADTKKKSMFLGPKALQNLETATQGGRTQREAVEQGLELLAKQDAREAALQEFINWATTEWGEPTNAERRQAEKILADQ